MQQYSKIASSFLLGVFGIFMLHQFLPHVHHDHNKVEVSFEHSSPDHHHHHDKDQQEEGAHADGLFNFLLNIHAHTLLPGNHSSIESLGNHQLGNFKNSIDQPIILTSNFEVISNAWIVSLQVHPAPGLRRPLFLSTFPHRGPPHLG